MTMHGVGRTRWVVIALLVAALALLGGCAQSTTSTTPRTITVWTYYNGAQLAAFNDLVEEFNETVGVQKSITVKSQNLGSVEDLQDAIRQSAEGKVGAEELPNIFAAYADTAYAIDKMGLLVDLSSYFSDAERAKYVEAYLNEGAFDGGESIKIFPVAKSVELLFINKTDFEPFAQEVGIDYDTLSASDGLLKAAELYYDWTDAKTETPNDGKAFFGLDSLANYFYIVAKQHGVSLVSTEGTEVIVDFDKDTVRSIWDTYYVPFVKGYCDATARYRSDDIKTGNIIASIGSSSSATYFPTAVINDTGTYEIEMEVLPCPQVSDGNQWAIQQGAGMSVVNTTEEEIQASVEFLKWFTDPARNIQFSVQSGYLPVTKEASDIGIIRENEPNLSPRMEQVLSEALATVNNSNLYTPEAFENGTAFRSVLERSLSALASADAEKVRQAVSDGSTREQALAPYLTDEYFETWYKNTKSELESLAIKAG